MEPSVSRLVKLLKQASILLVGGLVVLGEKPLPKLILISMDGFKHDYLELPGLKQQNISNFLHMVQNGVRAEYVVNVFPSVTYPNHFTLITGLYPESHGLVHNRFYDPDPKVMDHFWFNSRRDNFDPVWYDNGAEPIYVTNNKAGDNRKSGSVLWPCGLGKVKEIEPDRLIPNADPFNDTDFKIRVDYMVKWLADEKDPINLGLLYFNEPDEVAHATGAGSEEVKVMIGKLNEALGYLFESLRDAKILDQVNIILTADHGFTNRSEFVNFEDYDILEQRDYVSGSQFKNNIVEQWFPTNLTDLLKKFENEELKKKVDVYVKDSQNSSYQKNVLHYHDNIRIAPVVITGKQEGIYLVKDKEMKDNTTVIGVHGLDPYKFRSMNPFFLAMGPAFKKNFTIETFNSVDIYPLMCHILGVEPAPNNGSMDKVKTLLWMEEGSKEDSFTITSISFLVIIGLSVTVAGLYSICACHNARKRLRILRSTQRPSGISGPHTHHLLDSDGDDDEF